MSPLFIASAALALSALVLPFVLRVVGRGGRT